MKIRAIRVSQVGRFNDPVAVEDLSGRLDVLAGPNELGKSTLLSGLKAALFDRYNSKNRKLEALRPYGGGAPLVEVDVESDGRLWRLRKRFLSQPMAELTPLSGGPSFRGPEAEAQLGQILGAKDGDGRFAMLWLSQKDSIGAFAPGEIEGGVQSIEEALAREVATVAEGKAVLNVQREVRRRLGELMSAHATPRPVGPYRAARATLEAKREAMSAAQARHAAVTGLLDRVADLKTTRERLASPEQTTARWARAEAARQRLQEAKEASARRDTAAASLRAAESQLSQRRAARQAFAATRQEAQRLHGAILECEAQLASLAVRQAEADEVVARTVAESRELKEQGQALDDERAAAAAADTRRQTVQRVADLTARARAALEAHAEAEAARVALESIRVTPALAANAHTHGREISILRAQLEATAPRVRVAYLPGVDGAIRVGGQPLRDGDMRLVTGATTIEIAGVGRLQVDPGASSDSDDMQADLEARQKALADLLRQVGVGDLAELEFVLTKRREIERSLGDAMSKLAVLAPHGLQRLEAERSRESAKLSDVAEGEVTARPLAEIEAELQQVRKAHGKLVERLDGERQALARCREDVARFTSRLESDRKRHAEIVASLADIADLEAHAIALAQETESAEREANAVRRELTAWSERAPDPKGLQVLEIELAESERAIAVAERTLQEAQLEIANIEGQLETARNEDIEARLAEAAAAVAVAEAEVARFADEAAALSLLDRELSAVETSTRDRFLRPVIARLQPYLDALLPETTPVLASGYGLERIVRDEREELLSRLSDGTQEQLAVLVRLAFARLFADAGRPVPVVLDDALVYSDDARIARMFAVLEAAAEHHQLIVFTCRETAFRGLHAKQLSVVPWRSTA